MTTGYPISSQATSADSGVNAISVRGVGMPARSNAVEVRSLSPQMLATS
jgi:hypothetical protein